MALAKETTTRRSPEPKVRRLGLLVILFGLILFGRLTYLQVIKGPDYRRLSEANRIRTVRLQSPRGKIVDRYGHLIATNRYAFNLTLVPEDAGDTGQLLSFLGEGVELDLTAVRKKIEDADRHTPVLLKQDLQWQEMAFVEEHKLDLPGVNLAAQPVRYYPEGSAAAHLLGYVGEISEAQLKSGKFPEQAAGDVVGKYGLELQYDSWLRGSPGKKYIEVDALGRQLREMEQERPSPGQTLVLSLDWGLQRLADQLLGDRAGAIVALDPRNGDVLALASRPSFSPNSFARGISRAQWEELQTNPRHPLNNRALQGEYPPGSTYKIVTLTACLEEDLVEPDSSFKCLGGYPFGRRLYRCWKSGGHGILDTHEALVYSCDVFFYNLSTTIDIDTLARYANGFGLGRKTGITLPGERAGLIPTRGWKRERFGEPWYPGENLSVAIGQGYNLVTPLQMANLISAVANEGTVYEPHVLKRIEDASGSPVVEVSPKAVGRIPARPSTLRFVREALSGVVNERRGTGGKAKIGGITVAGKTGTAQVVRLGREVTAEENPEDYEDHAWFIAFAPYEDPRIALAVLIEHGGHGGSTCAPVARRIIEEYLGAGIASTDGGSKTRY